MSQYATRAALALYSEQYRPWVEVQRANLHKYEPQLTYIAISEEQLLAADWSTKSYSTTMQTLMANRPKAVLELFRQGYKEVLFLGADVHFYAPFWAILNQYQGGAVLTPHITEPLPYDAKTPTTMQVHRTGQCNSDFVLWRETDSTIRFLEWQADRLEQVCKDEVQTGFFYDQVYLSYAPYFIQQAQIIKHKGFNVAYWNLPHRRVSRTQNKEWTVNQEELLYCFQFSGYDINTPTLLSKYNGRREVETLEILQLLMEFNKCFE